MARRDASDLYGEEHVRRYRETDGEYGHDWTRGSPTLLLTTKGRRTGEPRTTPLVYGRHGDDYLVVASKGGADEPPQWFRNLEASPEAEVQVLADKFRARARVAAPDEHEEMWREMVSHWPDYDGYQQRTSRKIPVVVLERL